MNEWLVTDIAVIAQIIYNPGFREYIYEMDGPRYKFHLSGVFSIVQAELSEQFKKPLKKHFKLEQSLGHNCYFPVPPWNRVWGKRDRDSRIQEKLVSELL